MKINIFEGSRRIVWLIAGIATAIAGWNLLYPASYVYVSFALKEGSSPQVVSLCGLAPFLRTVCLTSQAAASNCMGLT